MANSTGHIGVSELITVTPGQPVFITIYPEGDQTITLNNSLQLTAMAVDDAGNLIPDIDFSWSVTPDSSVSIANGLFTAQIQNTYQVIASHSTVSSDAYLIEVLNEEMTALILSNPDSNYLAVDDSIQFQATAFNESGIEISGVSIDWHIEGDAGVAVIDETGKVIGVSEGSFRVKAVCGSFVAYSENMVVFCQYPDAFSLVDPVDETQDIPIASFFTWEEAPGADEYEIEIYEETETPELVVEEKITTNSYEISELSFQKLKFDTSYSWSVKAINKCGVTICSRSFTFRTEKPIVKAIYWPSDDAAISASNIDTNYGTQTPMTCSGTNSPNQILMRFDLEELSDREIVSARLQLQLSSATSNDDNFNVSLHRITGAWDEDTVTWNNSPVHDEDYLGTVAITVSDTPRVYEFDISDLAKQWCNGLSDNFGIILIDTSTDSDYGYIDIIFTA